MNNLLVGLAQCPCGGGGGARISYWAVLVPSAAILLCGLAYDIYARRRARKAQPEEPAEPGGEQHRNED
ncbi:MAG: hypothetical protein ACUVXJ_08315 [Phycisphaerae bacterium]